MPIAPNYAEPQTEAAPTEEPEAKEKRKVEPRDYIILSEGDNNQWEKVGEGTGINAQAAIISVIGKDENEGTYVAVPVRSWKPVSPKITTETKVSWA